ncbi:hypothetical protein B4N89_20770 [Embleya scabrispora]|uniref:Uncharacterized protein n=1 Tax=Embleya scabrispora TaxID=159449 RepID=A0A1T3P1T8_9ACTN|nr:hypothetical protein [Embleya scabrispora]OPC83048.1 hypothetical protein B4N89_20770 [Embleya scabrispora]
MPRLPKDAVPEVKLDSSGGAVEISLTRDQRRELFEAPDSTVMAVVELTAKKYSGTAASEEKAPQVVVRVTFAETARTPDEERGLREAMRAMFRRRKLDGTLDEVGPGPRDPSLYLDEMTERLPSEAEFRARMDA